MTALIINNIHLKKYKGVKMLKRWINTEEFENEFRIKQSTQRKMRREGVLAYSKIGGFVFYDRNLIDKLLEDHNVNATAEKAG